MKEKLKVPIVTLEHFSYADAEEYYKIAKDFEIRKFFRFAYTAKERDANELLDAWINSTNYEAFKILNERNKMVGAILLEKKPKKIMEVCYFIGNNYRRRGYCCAAIQEVIEYVKNTNYKTLEFCIACNNQKSQNVMKRMNAYKKYVGKYIHYQIDLAK